MAASAALEKPWAWTSTVRRVISPRPSTLTSAPLWTQAVRRASVSGSTAVEDARWLAEGVEVDGLVLDAERVVEALQLRDPLLERHLAALEAAGDGVAGVLALGAAAGGLAALAADAAADALGALVRRRVPGCRSWILHAVLRLRSGVVGGRHLDEVRDAGDHAADLGAVGQGVGLADAPEAERPQRAALLRLGVRAGRLDLGDAVIVLLRIMRHLARPCGRLAGGDRCWRSL